MQVLLGQLASGAIDPTQFTTAVDEANHQFGEQHGRQLQVDLKARQESIDDIRNMDWLPDAAQEGLIKNAGLEITVADEALREAATLIDGVPTTTRRLSPSRRKPPRCLTSSTDHRGYPGDTGRGDVRAGSLSGGPEDQ